MKESDSLKEVKSYAKGIDFSNKKSVKEIQKLVVECIYHCPSKKGPERSKKFKDYGILDGAQYKKLKKNILNALKIDDERYFYLDSSTASKDSKNIEDKLDSIHELIKDRKKTMIYFSNSSTIKSELDSLYISLRNAFAHGNFAKIKGWYIIWGEKIEKKKKKENEENKEQLARLSCFMMLKKEHIISMFKCLDQFQNTNK